MGYQDTRFLPDGFAAPKTQKKKHLLSFRKEAGTSVVCRVKALTN